MATHGGDIEGLKHDLSHLLTAGLGVQWSLSEQSGVLWGYTELIVESMVPDLLHVIPAGDDAAVFIGVLESQDTSLALGHYLI